jgi:hypothetical protein
MCGRQGPRPERRGSRIIAQRPATSRTPRGPRERCRTPPPSQAPRHRRKQHGAAFPLGQRQTPAASSLSGFPTWAAATQEAILTPRTTSKNLRQGCHSFRAWRMAASLPSRDVRVYRSIEQGGLSTGQVVQRWVRYFGEEAALRYDVGPDDIPADQPIN